MSKIRFVGLDVHAETIAVAVAEAGGEVRSHGCNPEPAGVDSEADSANWARSADLKACYEAGPTGYVLYWQLTQLGVACEVIAPSLVPTKAGRSGQDRPPRCRETGALLSRRGTDGGVGAGRGARSVARSGAGSRSRQERSTEGAASAGQVPAAPRPAAGRDESLDQEVPGVDQDSRPLRSGGAGSHAGRLPGGSGSRGGADS